MTDINQVVTHIDLVRHGLVATPGLFCAPVDEPLSDLGWGQLETTTRHAQPDVILTSPSRRCHEFAESCARQLGCPLATVGCFREMDFGRWVGQSTRQIWSQDEALLQTLWQTPLAFIAPEGEIMPDFIERVHRGWREMVNEYAGKRVLLLTHGGVIRVLLAMVLDVPYQKTLGFDLTYGSATRIRVYADGGSSVYGVGVETL